MTRTPVRVPETPLAPWRELYDIILDDAAHHRTMTPLHPQLEVFLNALQAILGTSLAEMSRNCPGRTAAQPFPVTTMLLTMSTIKGCDLARSLVALQALGGYCDCTVLVNAGDTTADIFASIVELALRVWCDDEMPPPPPRPAPTPEARS